MTKRRKTRTAPKAQSPAAFNTAHKRWLKTQAEWRAVAWGSTSKGMSEGAYDRLVAKAHDNARRPRKGSQRSEPKTLASSPARRPPYGTC